jgi:uncharacterized caspase-like protein
MKLTILLSAGLLALLPAFNRAGAEEPKGNKYAVMVGVSDYDHPKLRKLSFAENDVVELGDTLRAGGFNVTRLSDGAGAKDPNLKPTRANIIRELDRVLNACTKHDLVLVALSGHGMQPGGSKENFFCPADARVQDLSTLIGMSDLYDRLDRSAAKVKLILADACRDDPVEGKGITKVPLPPEGVGVLLSCSPGEQAYESKKYSHGVFYYFVLDALRNRKAMNDDGKITFGLLAEYVQRRVSRTTPELIGEGAKQSPNLVVNISGESPVLLTPEVTSNKIAANNPAPPAEKKEDQSTAKSTGESRPNPLVGSWASQLETVYFHRDGIVVMTVGPLYLKGRYSLDQGVLDISFTDVNWDLRINLTPVQGQPGRVQGQVAETNLPGFKIGHQFVWTRVNQIEPSAPPSRRELVGTWTNGTVTYAMNADHTFAMWFNGGQTRGTYSYNGNFLVVNYMEVNRFSKGLMTWADPQTKTTVRSTMLSSNLPGANPPGTYADFRRVR